MVTPKILSCIAGLQKCIGVPNIQSAKNWGCVVDEVTSCSGETEEKACGGCQSPLGIIHKLRCQRRSLVLLVGHLFLKGS